MESIIVKNITQRTTVTGKTVYDITDEKGRTMSTFKAGMEVNKLYDVDLKMNGQYLNISSWRASEPLFPQQPQPPMPPSMQAASPKLAGSTTGNNTKAMCLSYAKDLAVADKITMDEVLAVADAFDKWVKGDITVEDRKLINVLINKQPKEA